MRQRPDETYEQWIERVRVYELNRALNEIKNGADINLVMEAMSAGIMKRILHPILVSIREEAKTPFDAEASRASYFETMRGRDPVADHVEEEKIDKT